MREPKLHPKLLAPRMHLEFTELRRALECLLKVSPDFRRSDKQDAFLICHLKAKGPFTGGEKVVGSLGEALRCCFWAGVGRKEIDVVDIDLQFHSRVPAGKRLKERKGVNL